MDSPERAVEGHTHSHPCLSDNNGAVRGGWCALFRLCAAAMLVFFSLAIHLLFPPTIIPRTIPMLLACFYSGFIPALL